MSINHYVDKNLNPKLDLNCKLLDSKKLTVSDIDCNNLEVNNILDFNTLKIDNSTTEINTINNKFYNITTSNLNSEDISCNRLQTTGVVFTGLIKSTKGIYTPFKNKSYLNYTEIENANIDFYPHTNIVNPRVDENNWKLSISAVERTFDINYSTPRTVYQVKGNCAFTGAALYSDYYIEFTIGGLPGLTSSSQEIFATGFGQSALSAISSQFVLTNYNINTAGQITLQYYLVLNNSTFPANLPIYFNFDLSFI